MAVIDLFKADLQGRQLLGHPAAVSANAIYPKDAVIIADYRQCRSAASGDLAVNKQLFQRLLTAEKADPVTFLPAAQQDSAYWCDSKNMVCIGDLLCIFTVDPQTKGFHLHTAINMQRRRGKRSKRNILLQPVIIPAKGDPLGEKGLCRGFF